MRWLAIGALSALGGCALVLGFEDHEPFPESEGGQAGQAQGGAGTGGSGAGASGGGGAPGFAALLIPDRGTNAIGAYDPVDGTYIGDLIVSPPSMDPFSFESPNDAVQGPDGRLYVSDQLADVILRFEADGTFAGVFADASDGLDNVRGVDFRNGELFASVSPGGGASVVARFDMDGNRLADFVDDGSDPFDVTFLPSGTMLLANIADPDDVRVYDVNGGSSSSVVSIDFPQQISLLPGGTFAVAGWTQLLEVRMDGSIVRTLAINIGRGVHPLDNGHWIVTSDGGVEVIEPVSEQLIQTIRVGTGFTKVERATLPALP